LHPESGRLRDEALAVAGPTSSFAIHRLGRGPCILITPHEGRAPSAMAGDHAGLTHQTGGPLAPLPCRVRPKRRRCRPSIKLTQENGWIERAHGHVNRNYLGKSQASPGSRPGTPSPIMP
jgi:hypothetical protein